VSARDDYPAGVPCWVDNLGADPDRLREFYGRVFGWDYAGPGAIPGDPPGEYYVARLRGRDVAGIGSAPATAVESGWSTYIAVESSERAAADAGRAGGAVLVEPFEVPPAGRMAVLADPTGASFCVWEPGERRGAQRVNEPGAWSMSALSTSDPDRAARFYGALFGWRTEPFSLGDAEVTMFRLPGYVGGEPEQPVPRDVVATMVPGAPAGDGTALARWGVDFWIDDVDAAVATAAELGGSVVVPPYDLPMFRQAVLADPRGGGFTLTELVLDAAS